MISPAWVTAGLAVIGVVIAVGRMVTLLSWVESELIRQRKLREDDHDAIIRLQGQVEALRERLK